MAQWVGGVKVPNDAHQLGAECWLGLRHNSCHCFTIYKAPIISYRPASWLSKAVLDKCKLFVNSNCLCVFSYPFSLPK